MTPLGHHLAHLETDGLIYLAQMEPELEYTFRHVLVQDAAYQSMLFADRRKLHLQVGKKLEQLFPDRLDELAPTLAHHFALAEDNPQALKYYTLAGDIAAHSYASTEASDHYAHALEIIRQDVSIASSPQRIHLYTQFGRTCELNSDYDRALETYLEMEQLAEAHADRPLKLAALMARATVHATPSDKYDATQAESLSRQALTLAHELHDHPAEAKIYWNMMLAYIFSGEADRALTIGETALSIARQHNLREREAYILHDLTRVYLNIGQPEKSQQAAHQALELWRELDNKAMLADGLSAFAGQYVIDGDYDRALIASAEALQLSQSIGNLWNQSYSQMLTGLVYSDRGQFSQAIETMKTCIELGNRAGFMIPQVELGSYLGFAYGVLLGQFEEGFAWANHALAQAETMHPNFKAAPLVVQAYITFTQGNFTHAVDLYQKSLEFYDPNARGLSDHIFISIVQGELAFHAGKYGEVIEIIDNGVSGLRERHISLCIPDFLYLKGRAYLAQGQLDRAYTTLAKTRSAAEQIDAKRIMWLILATLAHLEDQRGNPAEAANLRQQARQILDYIAEHIHQPDLRTSFLNQPDVRAILEATTP